MLGIQGQTVATTSVLLVEDSTDDALLIRRALGRASTELRAAHVTSLAEALAVLERQEHGCVLLDLSLPDADDLEALQVLHQAHPDLPVVVLTGRQDDLGTEALKHGAQEYLVKGDIDAQLLLRTIRYAIERARTRQELAAVHARFRRAFEDGPLGMALVSLDPLTSGRVLDANRALAAVLGLPLHELTGAELPASVHWEDRGRLLEALDHAGGRGVGCHHAQLRLIRSDGRVAWVSLSMSVVEGTAGRPQYAIVQLEDVTRRRQDAEELREAKDALDNAVGGIARIDLAGAVASANRAYADLIGREPATVTGGDWLEPVHPGDRALVQRAADVMLDAGKADVEARLVRGDGSVVDAAFVLVRNLSRDGTLRGHFCFARDVSERRVAMRAMAASERRYRSIVETTSEGVLLLDREGHVQFGNRRVLAMLGLDEGGLLGRSLLDVVEDECRDDVRRLLAAAGAAGAAVQQQDVRLRRADGAPLWGLVSMSATSADLGHTDGVLAMVGDITERKRIELQLADQALRDPLTGLPNRTLLLDRIAHALARRPLEDAGVAVLFLDVDRFKDINDELGHTAGDEVLRLIGGRVAEAIRGCDTLARHGGDELVVLCDRITDEAEAAAVAERIVGALATPLIVGGAEVSVSVSIGLATSLRHATDAEELVRAADTAMYRAKQEGGGRYELYDEAMRSRLVRELSLQRDLRRALEERQLHLAYQPIASLTTGAPLGFEALLRWEHPDRGPVSPGEFIPIAERTGLMPAIGAYVLREACEQVARWRATHAEPAWACVSVNVSAHQIADPGFPGLVAETLRATGVPSTAILLEITETALLTGNDAAVACLEALREQGLRLFLDDFGTGFSSLSHLVRYPVDGVKIDRSFVGTLDDGEGAGRPVVEGVIGMAQALGLVVVAEGIETVEQLRTLAHLGCARAQGYFLGRPMPAPAALRWALAPPELLELRGAPAGTAGEMLTIQQATTALGISASTLRRWADTGRLQVLRTAGGHRRVPAAEVQRLNRLQRSGGAAVRLVEPGQDALPGLAALLADDGERLATAVAARLYDLPARGFLASEAGRALAVQWLTGVRRACTDASWSTAHEASAGFVAGVRLGGGTVLEAQCFLERFGETAAGTLQRDGHRDEASKARRLFVSVRQHALGTALQ